ncbi:hypothetical protein OSTOST_10730, partial [Ostertagia ostertagi]
ACAPNSGTAGAGGGAAGTAGAGAGGTGGAGAGGTGGAGAGGTGRVTYAMMEIFGNNELYFPVRHNQHHSSDH